jgi:phage gp36-like protein
MAYCTVNDVQLAAGGSDALIELSDLENAGVIDVVAVNAAIKVADARINTYVGQRSAVPLAIVPDSIATMSCDWAIRVLRRRRWKGVSTQGDLDAEKADVEWLVMVAKGEVQLGIQPTAPKADIVIDKAAPRDTTLSISRERMKDFI